MRAVSGAVAVALFSILTSCLPVHAQDSIRVNDNQAWLEDHSPEGALWRAAAVPGWGQLYNRQYYKIPLVWAGLVGIAATTLYVNQRYLLYRHAFHYVAGTNTSPEYEQDYLQLLSELQIPVDRGPEYTSAFEQTRDRLRRNRDLLYFGIGLFYGLTILDAYVNAHLLDFDIDEDLTLSVHPVPRGFSASIRFGR